MTQPEGSKMWGGRFERPPDASFYEFERSWQFDRRLLPQELALDRAWARAIAAAGILNDEECAQIVRALDEKLGPLGAKLHTGRSRNEMVATEFRMYVKDASIEIQQATTVLARATA